LTFATWTQRESVAVSPHGSTTVSVITRSTPSQTSIIGAVNTGEPMQESESIPPVVVQAYVSTSPSRSITSGVRRMHSPSLMVSGGPSSTLGGPFTFRT